MALPGIPTQNVAPLSAQFTDEGRARTDRMTGLLGDIAMRSSLTQAMDLLRTDFMTGLQAYRERMAIKEQEEKAKDKEGGVLGGMIGGPLGGIGGALGGFALGGPVGAVIGGGLGGGLGSAAGGAAGGNIDPNQLGMSTLGGALGGAFGGTGLGGMLGGGMSLAGAPASMLVGSGLGAGLGSMGVNPQQMLGLGNTAMMMMPNPQTGRPLMYDMAMRMYDTLGTPYPHTQQRDRQYSEDDYYGPYGPRP